MSKNRNLWNLLYLILAIVVAAGIWFYVDEHSDRTVSVTVTDIPIEYTNQASLTDNGLMLVEGDDSGTDATIDITFKGKRRHVVRLDRSKIRVTVSTAQTTWSAQRSSWLRLASSSVRRASQVYSPNFSWNASTNSRSTR